MKKAFLSVMIAFSLSFGSGIPVIDTAGIAQMVKDSAAQAKTWVEEATRWTQTVQQFKDDLMAQAKELATKTGIRDVMKFAKDIKGIYNDVQGLSQSFQEVANSFDLSKADEKAFDLMTKMIGEDICAGYDDITETNTCKKSKVAPWKEAIAIENSAKNLEKLSKRLEDLSEEISKDKGDQEDLKASADMANQINLTIAQLQAEKARIDLELSHMQRQKEQAERAAIEKDNRNTIGVSKKK